MEDNIEVANLRPGQNPDHPCGPSGLLMDTDKLNLTFRRKDSEPKVTNTVSSPEDRVTWRKDRPMEPDRAQDRFKK